MKYYLMLVRLEVATSKNIEHLSHFPSTKHERSGLSKILKEIYCLKKKWISWTLMSDSPF